MAALAWMCAGLHLLAAPVPRPPHPTRTAWISLSSAAWTCGMTVPAKAVAAVTRPVFFRNSRRDVVFFVVSLMRFSSYGLKCAPKVKEQVGDALSYHT